MYQMIIYSEMLLIPGVYIYFLISNDDSTITIITNISFKNSFTCNKHYKFITM